MYELFAIRKPKVRQLPFAEVLKTVNNGLAVEQRFTLLEAKRVLKYMKETLFDSLCVDGVAEVDLEGSCVMRRNIVFPELSHCLVDAQIMTVDPEYRGF